MAKKRRKVARKAQRPAGGDGAGPPRKAQRLADDSGVDAVGAAEGGPPLAEALRAELRPLKLRALTKRAEAAGVDDDSLDAAEDAASVIELIVAKETAPTTQAAAEATRGEEEELGVSLPSLDMLLKAQSQNSKPGWTDDADEYIVAYVNRHGKSGKSWQELSARFGGLRSASAVRSRWYMLAGPSANVKGGWVERRKKPSSGEQHSASPQADSGSIARTSSGTKKKQRIETASELGIATRDAGAFRTPVATEVGPPLPQQQGRTAFYLAGVAPHLTCSLCDKLFTDAHTIRECLHTFCKSCVDAHIEEFRKCPKCGIKVRTGGAAPPVRSDRALQSLVDKINAVLKEQRSGGYEDEDEFEVASPSNKERTARKELSATVVREGGNSLCITLMPVPQEQLVGTGVAAGEESGSKGSTDTPGSGSADSSTAVSPTSVRSPTRSPSPKLRRSSLPVSDRVTVFHLKQFLAAAFAVRSLKQVEVLCVGAALGDDMSLEYVLKTHWRGHAHDELLALHYQMRDT